MDRLDDELSRLTYGFGLSTINTKYVAFAIDDGYLLYHLDNLDQPEWWCEDTSSRVKSKHVLQLCSIKTDWLAISCGSQTAIRNVLSWAIEHKIPGNGRAVTALAWSRHDADLLAVGTVDGSISIWSLSTGTKLLHRLSTGGPVCRTIEFSPHHGSVLATSDHDSVQVWSFRETPSPIFTLLSTYGRIINLQWNPVTSGRLLGTTAEGNVVLWHISMSDIDLGTNNDQDSDMQVLGELDDFEGITKSIPGHCISHHVAHAAWIREQRLLLLAGDRRKIVFAELGAEMRVVREMASILVDPDMLALDLWSPYGRLVAKTYSADLVRTHEVPASVAEHIQSQFSDDDSTARPILGETSSHYNDDSKVPFGFAGSKGTSTGMKPESIVQKRKRQPARPCKVMQSSKDQTRSTSQPPFSLKRFISRAPVPHNINQQEMTSSLELPGILEDDNSPMPFLSPSIPARKSPATIGMDENLQLPLLPESSLHILPTAQGHDSDSDDETYAPEMKGSGTLMPGGGNVPLPRLCGALFGPGGQLVVFLPPKQQATTTHHEQARETELHQSEGNVPASKLFPSFGNLITQNIQASKSTYVYTADGEHSVSRVALQLSSQPSKLIWQMGTSPKRIESGHSEDSCPIDLRIYDIASLLSTSRDVAEECRIFCNDNESGADLCQHNARVADAAGFYDAASIWQLLAMVLEDSVPLHMLHKAKDDENVLVIAREASMNSATDKTRAEHELPGKLRWAEHPFGAAWCIEQILLWAEQHADMHMLACISAILCQSDIETSSDAQQAVLTKLPSFSQDFSVEIEHRALSHTPFQSIPLLPMDSNLSNYLDDTPAKVRQNSAASSRNPSLPTTPLLDSSSSTPPFVFPGLSRKGSRVSASGSASPEHHRSSFSAAAKFYAQSITDKISSYGSSPPLKKVGPSPSANELSSSLPAGSWSKSVSFASAISTTRDSQLSRSFTVGEDGYDSDKTIDETSLPHTPRSNQGEVTIKMKTVELFSDERSGGAKSSLIPAGLVTKTDIWRQHYAGQLRVWNLWMQAAELEKVSRLSTDMPTRDPPHQGPVLARVPGQRRPTCSICLSMVQGLQQACPRCLHTMHLTCLAEYVQSLGQEEFVCPASCDCICTALEAEAVNPPAVHAVELSSATSLYLR